jgi:transketolase
MRNTFVNEMIKLAQADERVWLLTGDLGFGVLEPFAQLFPERFVNVGVAEQNMTGIAAGLALDNRVVFTYSIANFSTLRCLEQIRNDICYHNLNVRVMSVGAGLAYGSHGYTHFAIEDLAIMRALPNLSILSPADPWEARRAAEIAVQHTGPMYIRLGKNGEPALHSASNNDGDTDKVLFDLAKLIELIPAGDITLIATGSIAFHAFQAATILRAEGYSVGMYSCPSIHPFDHETLAHICNCSRWIVSVEEHAPIGGLSSLIAEQMAQRNWQSRLVPLTLPRNISGVGSQEYFLKTFQLDAEGISNRVRSLG